MTTLKKKIFNFIKPGIYQNFVLADFAYSRANQECLFHCFRDMVTEEFSEDI